MSKPRKKDVNRAYPHCALSQADLDALVALSIVAIKTFPFTNIAGKRAIIAGNVVVSKILSASGYRHKDKKDGWYVVKTSNITRKDAENIANIVTKFFTIFEGADRNTLTSSFLKTKTILVTKDKDSAKNLYSCLSTYGYHASIEYCKESEL